MHPVHIDEKEHIFTKQRQKSTTIRYWGGGDVNIGSHKSGIASLLGSTFISNALVVRLLNESASLGDRLRADTRKIENCSEE